MSILENLNFIHFGCWNKNNSPFNNVIDNINKSINDVEFISVAGDNYYPSKKKVDGVKVKTLNMDNLNSGFEKLKSIPKPIYLTFGNHDIDDFSSCKHCHHEKEACIKCTNLEAQVGISKESQINIYPETLHIESTNSIIFFLDSSVYELIEENNDEDMDIKDTCYTHLNLSEDIKTLTQLIDYQLTYVKNNIKNHKNVLFVFHHPIISKKLKEKDGKKKEKVSFSNGLINFYIELNKLLVGKNIYHLCADTHYYQSSIVTINDLLINQYIVGTGGADLDEGNNNSIEINSDNKIIYNPIEYNHSYGYLHVVENDDSFTFKFISISDEAKNKYLKYKTKYLKLKEYKNLL